MRRARSTSGLPGRAAMLALAAVLALALAGCTGAPEHDPSQWPLSRLELERAIPTDDPAEATYRTSCLACHGVDGRGAGGATGADFTSPEGPLRHPDAQLIASIRDGRRGDIGVMPAHGAILGEARIIEVLAYVRRQFGANVPVEPEGGEAEGGEARAGEALAGDTQVGGTVAP
jgi:mono/diheme cytochrome c family protein